MWAQAGLRKIPSSWGVDEIAAPQRSAAATLAFSAWASSDGWTMQYFSTRPVFSFEPFSSAPSNAAFAWRRPKEIAWPDALSLSLGHFRGRSLVDFLEDAPKQFYRFVWMKQTLCLLFLQLRALSDRQKFLPKHYLFPFSFSPRLSCSVRVERASEMSVQAGCVIGRSCRRDLSTFSRGSSNAVTRATSRKCAKAAAGGNR